LQEVRKNRKVQRARREKNEIPIVALVGYTNAGKSALMNKILEITLTARDGGAEKIPMCGVPFHSSAGYIDTLVNNGHILC